MIMRGVRLSKGTDKTLQQEIWTEGKDNDSIYQFKKGDYLKNL